MDVLVKAVLGNRSRRNDTKFMEAYVAKGRSFTEESDEFAIKSAVAKSTVFSPRSKSEMGALFLTFLSSLKMNFN